MKKIIVTEEKIESINLNEVDNETPIFAKKNGVICGMVVNEINHKTNPGWILRLGGASGCSGTLSTRKLCIEHGLNYGYEFFVM